jgi:ribose transport system ATP-binding protein
MEEMKIPDEKMKEPILEVRNITKHFPGVQALNDVSLKFYAGEVHAVVGENGAGKSTLMKILRGGYVHGSGEILLDGNKVTFTHPQEAHERGISIIYQEFNLLPDRTVAQNIYLGREPSKFGLVDSRQMNRMAEEVMREIGIEGLIAPTAIAGTLSVAEQQLIEIAKAISLKSRILIMDEPTAALTSIRSGCWMTDPPAEKTGYGDHLYLASLG